MKQRYLIPLFVVLFLSWGSVIAEPQSTTDYKKTQIKCIATAIYHEARGEVYDGQIGVAHVVLNRVRNQNYPFDACEVIYQPYQFTDIKKTKIKRESKEWKIAKLIAEMVYEGAISDPTNGSLWFYAQHKIAKPKWAYGKKVAAVIGNITFIKKGKQDENSK